MGREQVLNQIKDHLKKFAISCMILSTLPTKTVHPQHMNTFFHRPSTSDVCSKQTVLFQPAVEPWEQAALEANEIIK